MNNIRSILNTDINLLLKEFLSKTVNNNYNNVYSGKVVDNNDPDKTGRCKINVFGVYDDIPLNDLPWAMRDSSFVGSLVGDFIIPPIGAIVKVFFDNGDIYNPRYTSKVLEIGKLPKDKDENYPDNLIFFETDNGDKFSINRKTKDIKFVHSNGTIVSINGTTGEYKFSHESGSSITMDKLGNIKIDHKSFLEDNGIAVIPTGQGPFCAQPFCPLMGLPLQGQKVAPGV